MFELSGQPVCLHPVFVCRMLYAIRFFSLYFVIFAGVVTVVAPWFWNYVLCSFSTVPCVCTVHSVHCGWAVDSLHALCTLCVQIFLQQFNSFICFHRIFSRSIQLSPFLLKHFAIQIYRISYFAHYQHETVNISFWFSTNTWKVYKYY